MENTIDMKVTKRNGILQDISFDKILERIRKLGQEACVQINYSSLAMKVIEQLYDKIETTKIDELAAEQCAAMSTLHTDYGVLASRIVISNHQKNTNHLFSDVVKILYNFTDIHNKNIPLISDELWNYTQQYSQELNDMIDHNRDYLIDYFGFKTLERAYLFKVKNIVVERIQHMWMRVSVGIHGDINNSNSLNLIKETYDLMSLKYFTHATPTLFNAGTPRPQLSSCYLISMEEDSIEGIYNTLKDCAQISKYSGGIGLHIHNIRAKGSHIQGTNGKTDGIVPMLKVFNSTARYVNQSGKRNGSFAIYLEPWHPDIEDFLEMKKNHGDEELKARDLFYAIWMCDLFMERVKENKPWSLFCPHECSGLSDVYGDEFKELYELYESSDKARKTINSRELWFKILDSQMETGTPYILYKDAANKKSNQKNIGTIKSSNLCVAPETLVLTDKGHFEIQSMCGKDVNVWNGTCFSSVTILKTGIEQSLLDVFTDDGSKLTCTPYHKFYIQEEKNVIKLLDAKDLKPYDKIINCDFPVIDGPDVFLYSYTHGFFYENENDVISSDLSSDTSYVYLPEEDSFLLQYMGFENYRKSDDYMIICLPSNIKNKLFIPFNCSLKDKLEWFSGYCDSRATIDQVDGLKIYSSNYEFFKNIKLLLQTCGINPKINSGYSSKNQSETYVFLISLFDLNKLYGLGFNTKKLPMFSFSKNNLYEKSYVSISRIEYNNRVDDTYCFTEPLKHMGVFNGILTGQCTEIIEYSDEKETAVCNLASIALPSFVNEETKQFDYDKLHKVTKVVTTNLNKIIDINYYPTDKTRRSNILHRPIGIGIQGLADTFIMMDIAFCSEEAREVNKLIFETIYHGALERSNEIAIERNDILWNLSNPQDKFKLLKDKEIFLPERFLGSYSSFVNSPTSKGILQFDMWNIIPSERYDWNKLKHSIVNYGLRNSLLLAPMPTASTSQILGFNECFEPFTSNLYTRRTLAGEFVIVNKYLMKELIQLGVWNEQIKNNIIANMGSVQQLSILSEHIRNKYKIVWEIPMKHIIDMSADRGAFICQSQSLNLWVEDPTYNTLTSMHFYSWKKGLKTGIYYLRRKAKHQPQQFTIEPEIKKNTEQDEICMSCSA
jgi:ribonucleoside-diphosphate reductase alpha chain